MKKTWLDQPTPEIAGGDMLLLMAGDLAVPMIGGIGSARLLTLPVIPAIDMIWRWHKDIKFIAGKPAV